MDGSLYCGQPMFHRIEGDQEDDYGLIVIGDTTINGRDCVFRHHFSLEVLKRVRNFMLQLVFRKRVRDFRQVRVSVRELGWRVQL